MSRTPITRVVIQEEDFYPANQQEWLRQQSLLVGAVAEFTGLVRADEHESSVIRAIFLEHYSPMTERSIEKIIEQAAEKWQLIAVSVVHRIGYLATGDRVVYVGVASRHRKDALACVGFIMDYLKNDVPIWKKEISEHSSGWVTQKTSDVSAKQSWT
jgi:molybdopterin synthase catalytic subunit